METRQTIEGKVGGHRRSHDPWGKAEPEPGDDPFLWPWKTCLARKWEDAYE